MRGYSKALDASDGANISVASENTILYQQGPLRWHIDASLV